MNVTQKLLIYPLCTDINNSEHYIKESRLWKQYVCIVFQMF